MILPDDPVPCNEDYSYAYEPSPDASEGHRRAWRFSKEGICDLLVGLGLAICLVGIPAAVEVVDYRAEKMRQASYEVRTVVPQMSSQRVDSKSSNLENSTSSLPTSEEAKR